LGLVPAQTKKKEKIGTIFCPKGGLAVGLTVKSGIGWMKFGWIHPKAT
jgi:hypothetical protein